MELFFTTVIGLILTLGLASLGGLFSERSGVINIGIEGMMSIGALVWSISGVYMHNSSNSNQIISFILAAVMGSLISLLHGFVSISLRGNQIISGTAINMLSAGIALFLINAYQFGPRVGSISSGYKILGFVKTGFWSQISVLLIPVIIIFIVAWFVLKKTTWGLRLRTVGENPIAAEAAGINVITKRYQALVIAGALAGLGGGFFVQYLQGTFYGSVQGYGFLALGILIFGQWKVHWVGLATIAFSLFTVLGNLGQLVLNVDWLKKIPPEFLSTLPFISSIFIMILTSKSMSSPKALGMPYIKNRK